MDFSGKNPRATSSRKFKMQSKSEIDVLSPDKASKLSVESAASRLIRVELDRYCPKKLFYIVFVNETGNDSRQLLDRFSEISQNYEVVSSVTFITRDNVLDLLDISNGYIFPNQLKPLLLNVIDNVKQCSYNIPPLYEAEMVKLKLIQVMYEQYVNKVKQNVREKNLEDLLNFLSRECKKKQKKEDAGPSEKQKSPVREETRKKNKKDDNDKQDAKDDDIDYTSIPLDNDGISFEENVFDYVWFYCITGYYDNEIIQCLTEQLNCPLCAIIKVTDSRTGISYIQYKIDSFWENIDKQFFANTTSYSFLEDTMLMHYIPSNKFTEENLVDLFQQFVFVLRRIIDIKLTHLKYLRHLSINKIENIYPVVPLDCLQTYHRSLKYFPVDSVNSILIIDALVKEVCSHLDLIPLKNTTSSRSVLSKCSVKSIHSPHCTDPLHDFEAFSNAKRKSSISSIRQNVNSFIVHDDDVLLKVSKFYKHVGPRIFDISLDLMKRIPVFKNILLKTEYPTQDIPHTHDVDPSHKSDKSDVKYGEILNYFMYLFLFNTFSNKMDEPNNEEIYNLTKNLITFNAVRHWNDVQPKCDADCIRDKVNLYNTPLIHFRWKEKLSSDVMIQKIFKANEDFLYNEQKYSPETDNFLIVFSDKLDSFGLNTKIFEKTIRTPICLRDFCRFTTLEEAEWLKKHETKIIDEQSFKVDLKEVCPGAYKVKTQMKLFQEYSYLLDGNIKEVDDNKKSTDLSGLEVADSQQSDINFEDAFIDLQRYPDHKQLINECEQASEAQQLASYDLGSNALRITGHVTTFCSHDGVKVTVDNTRFLQKPDKCTVNIQSNGVTLTLHSCEALKSEPYVLNLLLQNGSRVSFVVQRNDIQITKSSTGLEHIQEESEKEIKNVVYDPPNKPTEDKAKESSISQVVHCVDESFFKNLFQTGQSLESLVVSEDREELLEAILTARENNGVIYKVDTESKYLKRLNRDVTVPVKHALRNVFPQDSLVNGGPKPYENYTKLFASPNGQKSDSEIITETVDFRLCLPNGLFVRAHPGVIDKNNIMIKQEYAEDKPKLEPVQHEEFRLFSYHGFICIKKIDGTLTILKGNGDIIDFEKPSDESGENNSFKPCHCSTLNDYRNKLNKMLKDENNSEYFTSRRGHITHKQNHVMDKKLLQLLENFDVPYLKKSITRFDGKRIKIQGNKITQKDLHHMTSQQDFFTEEIYFERSDDFRSTFERNGSQKILFPDGTLISNSVNIADELVDDFVYVTISFQYEHPNYATVTYDFDKTLKVMLDDEVVIKRVVGQNGFIVNTKKNISVSVTKENVSFQKTCEDCSGLFQCNLNIEPFYLNKWTPSEEFLHVHDTYEKHFYSDYIGNCSRKSEHITGRTNSLNCNHYKKSNDYKLLFVVNKDLAGEMFATNETVQLKIKDMTLDLDATVSCYKMVPSKIVKQVDCRKKYFIGYCDRFYNNSVYKYFYHNIQNPEIYTTFRVFHNIISSVQDIEVHVLNLRHMYFSDFYDSPSCDNIFKNIATLITDLQVYHKAYEMEMHAEKENIERKKKDQEEEETRKRNALCHCIKQRITMADKINNWKKICAEYKKKIRSKKVPCYFNSDFCRRSD